jgi:hypothetical protein
MQRPMASLVWLGVALGVAWSTRASAQTEPIAVAAKSEAATEPSWSLRLSGGFGFGTRDFDLPRDGVIYESRTGIFPAADLGFELDHAASDHVGVGLHLRFQSSVGLSIVEQHTDGSERAQDLRSQRLELAIAPTFRFDTNGRWALLTSIGYGISDLRPEVHLETPGYFLAGPHLRAELQIPLAGERVRLRLGPEVQWIAHVGQELVHRGVAKSGFGAGGVAAVEVMLGRRWTVDASYRELRIWVDSSEAGAFEDVARFVTARLTGTL